MLQPNIQECEFGHYAPELDGLDPSPVCQFYIDLCRVGRDCGICFPAWEEFRLEDTFSVIECGDAPTARVPKFCQSQAPQWEAIIYHHLKLEKVIPSSHPQATEIRHNPNGYEALMLLILPYHPAFAENGILIQCWMIKRSICLLKQISYIEIISTCSAATGYGCRSSGVFYAIDSATLQPVHRCTVYNSSDGH